jgi:type II secretory pathway pseudopilin PulG
VVLTIVAILLSSLMWTLSAQTEGRNRDETLRGWSSRRSCCSASRSSTGGCRARRAAPNAPACNAGGDWRDEQPAGGGACTDGYAGYLPGRTLGFQPVDPAGYALDAWNNRIRYAVAQTSSGAQPNHFTNAAN